MYLLFRILIIGKHNNNSMFTNLQLVSISTGACLLLYRPMICLIIENIQLVDTKK